MFGDLCSSHANATDLGEAPTRAATAESTEDWRGLNPPSGKNGT